jgi:hypothetical protein
MEPEIIIVPMVPDWTMVVLQRGNAPGDEFHSNHRPGDALLTEVADSWAECFQHLFWERLAGLGGELGGGLPGDEEELGFFKNIDEEPAALEVIDFPRPLQFNEVILSPGGGDEGDAAQALVQSRGAKGEEVAEVHHRWLDVDPRLAGVGEDRQQGDRSGVKVDHLDSIRLQDR